MDLEDFRIIPPWDWPEDAGNLFRKTLADKSARESDRLIAAEMAGDLVAMNDRLAGALMTVLRDAGEPEDLRAQAAIAFGAVLEQADTDEFEDPDSVPLSERTFRKIRDLLQELYFDNSAPNDVRRRVLEASVRAPAEWQEDAIAAAYSSGDPEWMLTAVFAMRWVRGFDDQILEALQNPDLEIQYEAVVAAGNWELDAAWPRIIALVEEPGTEKNMLIAAIGAIGTIRPLEAREILETLAISDDEEIAEAAEEAILTADSMSDFEEEDDEEEEGEWIN